mmetsp:Transcript_49090/g.116854  ORF Transcript_49090/g.116854 Transcript_49090/m.116854 type:complete len:310 (+) Transcript_49090:136-1065(+)
MYLIIFPNRDYAVGAVTGVAASVVALIFGHPVESIKVRLQSGEVGRTSSEGMLSGAARLMNRPYAGFGAHLVQYSILNSVRFGSYSAAIGFFRRRAEESGESPNRTPSLTEVFLAGSFSGCCMAAAAHPFWVVKTHQQANRLSPQEAMSRLWHGEGLRGLFRGYVSSFVRFPVALAVMFTAYEALGRAVSDAKSTTATASVEGDSRTALQSPLRWLGKPLIGAVSGVLCWTSIYPLDVVQSRMLGEARYGQDRLYPSALQAFREVHREGGWKAFTRGYSAVLLRAGPVNAVLLPVNEGLHPLIQQALPQ